MVYTIAEIGAQNQWIITNKFAQFVGEFGSLALALAFLATILQFNDSVVYIDQPVTTVVP